MRAFPDSLRAIVSKYTTNPDALLAEIATICPELWVGAERLVFQEEVAVLLQTVVSRGGSAQILGSPSSVGIPTVTLCPDGSPEEKVPEESTGAEEASTGGEEQQEGSETEEKKEVSPAELKAQKEAFLRQSRLELEKGLSLVLKKEQLEPLKDSDIRRYAGIVYDLYATETTRSQTKFLTPFAVLLGVKDSKKASRATLIQAILTVLKKKWGTE